MHSELERRTRLVFIYSFKQTFYMIHKRYTFNTLKPHVKYGTELLMRSLLKPLSLLTLIVLIFSIILKYSSLGDLVILYQLLVLFRQRLRVT